MQFSMYVSKWSCSVMLQLHLDLQQDFNNTAFKIKHKLYTGSVAPLPK